MPKFCTVVDAEQFRPAVGLRHGSTYAALGTVFYVTVDSKGPYLMLRVRTDVVVVSGGDWIIKSANGALSVCEPDMFAATYEPIEASAPPPAQDRR